MVARYVTEPVGALERHGERPAIGAGAEVLRFREVLDAVYRLAGALHDAGVPRGTGPACVTGGNPPQALLVRLAAHVLGARLTQVVRGPAVHGVEFILRDCRPGPVVHDVPLPDTGAPRLGLHALLAAAAAACRRLGRVSTYLTPRCSTGCWTTRRPPRGSRAWRPSRTAPRPSSPGACARP
ncbi:hypothetical protein ACQKM2_02985 [Streptomyces sp. NPDC004126]|uniref:hypothetical protein n=1 Tax=Streptomyces sp. NPDC004126 TaxID=3390695 RepID=UPI003CFF234C